MGVVLVDFGGLDSADFDGFLMKKYAFFSKFSPAGLKITPSPLGEDNNPAGGVPRQVTPISEVSAQIFGPQHEEI